MAMTPEERQSLIKPTWCPLCDFIMKDDQTYFKWNCCNLCFIQFIEHREERWEAGYRPSAEEINNFVNKMLKKVDS
jgi:hypothetical protein